MGEECYVFAYAMAERAKDKGDEDWYKDTSNAVQIGESLSQLMVFRLEGHEAGTLGEKSDRAQRICEAAYGVTLHLLIWLWAMCRNLNI